MKNSFVEVRDGSSKLNMKKQRVPMKQKVKRILDDTEDIQDFNETKQTKGSDERDALIEMFAGLLGDVTSNKDILKPLYANAVKRMFLEHCKQSCPETMRLFIQKYGGLIEGRHIRNCFIGTCTSGLPPTIPVLTWLHQNARQHLKALPLDQMFRYALKHDHLEMAKFIHELHLAGHGEIKDVVRHMNSCKSLQINTFLCELTNGVAELALSGYTIANILPTTIKKLTLLDSKLIVPELDLSTFTELTHLDISAWCQFDKPVILPTSIQEVSFNGWYNQPLNLEHCHKLTKLRFGIIYNQDIDISKCPDIANVAVGRHYKGSIISAKPFTCPSGASIRDNKLVWLSV